MRIIAFALAALLGVSMILYAGVQLYMAHFSLKLMEQAGWAGQVEDNETPKPVAVSPEQAITFVDTRGRPAAKVHQRYYRHTGDGEMPRGVSFWTYFAPEELLAPGEAMPADDLIGLMVQARAGRVAEGVCRVVLEQAGQACKVAKFDAIPNAVFSPGDYRVTGYLSFAPAHTDPLPQVPSAMLGVGSVELDPVQVTASGIAAMEEVQRQSLRGALDICDEVRAAYGNCTLTSVSMRFAGNQAKDDPDTAVDETGIYATTEVAYSWLEPEPAIVAAGPDWMGLSKDVNVLRVEGGRYRNDAILRAPGRLSSARHIDVTYMARIEELFGEGEAIPAPGALRDLMLELRARRYLAEKCDLVTESFAQACDVSAEIRAGIWNTEALAFPQQGVVRIDGSLRFVPRDAPGRLAEAGEVVVTTYPIKVPDFEIADYLGPDLDHALEAALNTARERCAELRASEGHCDIVAMDNSMRYSVLPRVRHEITVIVARATPIAAAPAD